MSKAKVGLLPLAVIAGIGYLILKAAAAKKATVMFITGAPWLHLADIERYFGGDKFVVWPWNYCFLDFVDGWGDYFNYRSSDTFINENLAWFKVRGFKNILYVDPTEAKKELAYRWQDSVLETGDWWALMTLDPAKSWYQYLKQGMLGMTERFSATMDGFAIDRLDRAYTPQEVAWAVRLLDEVRAESRIPVSYAMNSLQPWHTEAAKRAAFIGTDGVDVTRLDEAMQTYSTLASFTELKRYYLVGRTFWMEGGEAAAIQDLKTILARHGFIFIESDRAARYIPALFP